MAKEIMFVRLEPEDKALLAERARARYLQPSTYLRTLILDVLRGSSAPARPVEREAANG